jgi:MFS family permease
MNYMAAISDFFKSPKWMMNMLLGGVCALIPFIGPIVLMGWLITGFWGRDDQAHETFPDFDFNHFVKYLERGIWPFLVMLVVTFVLGFVMSFLIVPLALVPGMLFAGNDGNASGAAGAVMALFMMVLYAVMVLVMIFVVTPLMIRASIVQDFAKSFDFAFAKRFVAATWMEIVLGSLFLMGTSIVLACLGMLAFCVGIYLAMVPIYFAWFHLEKQLYNLYLERGGEPVPLSPKLRDIPPPMPVV